LLPNELLLKHQSIKNFLLTYKTCIQKIQSKVPNTDTTQSKWTNIDSAFSSNLWIKTMLKTTC